MKIKLKKITVRDLTEGYSDDGEGGVIGYGGRLDIRPPYQREFVYNDAQRDAVVDTISKGFPLNVMYWAVRDDGRFEIIDGQQRTIAIARYVKGKFSVRGIFGYRENRAFHRLQNDEQEKILDYTLHVYLCTGSDSDRLKWFETINIAGAKLTLQEIRNAVYYAPWLGKAKRDFSRRGCPAYQIGKDYVKGSPIRQDYLERAIQWINQGDVVGYMNQRKGEADANELWMYFESVINWVRATFTEYRKEMKGVDWGSLFAAYKDAPLDPVELERRVAELMMDDDVTKKSGIYQYVLSQDEDERRENEKHLNIRSFTPAQKRATYEKQKGVCPRCNKKFSIEDMQGDHIDPWSQGGHTTVENCQMLCKTCNRRKSNL